MKHGTGTGTEMRLIVKYRNRNELCVIPSLREHMSILIITKYNSDATNIFHVVRSDHYM